MRLDCILMYFHNNIFIIFEGVACVGVCVGYSSSSFLLYFINISIFLYAYDVVQCGNVDITTTYAAK